MTAAETIRRLMPAAALSAVLGALLTASILGPAGARGVERPDARTPDTRIEPAPDAPTGGTDAVFVSSSTEPRGARLGCSLDGGPFRRCGSPKSHAELGGGRHIVRTVDAAGNVDRTRASRARMVGEDHAPVVTIEGAPRIESYHEYHYFEFSADVPGSAFYCSLDDEPFVPCATGRYRHVPYGEYVFRVYAVSPGGIRGETAGVEYESRDPNWD